MVNTIIQTNTDGAILAQPEFADHKQAYQFFGLNRSHLYLLSDAGLIRSISLRQPGKIKGRRLFDCASIRAYLQAHYAEPKATATINAQEAAA